MIVTNSFESVSVTKILDRGLSATANACASLLLLEASAWYVNRVIVPEAFRGQGVGGQLLERLKEEVVKNGGKKLIVEPGGYGADPARQRHFYEKHGFVRVADHWEWLP